MLPLKEKNTMCDSFLKIGKSLIHHGNINNRVYLTKLNSEDFPDIIDIIENISIDNNYSKIIVKIPRYAKEIFIQKGYLFEAIIPKFYNFKDDAFFLAKYFSPERKDNFDKKLIEDVLNTALNKGNNFKPVILTTDETFRKAEAENSGEIASIYEKVFETYPFPIYDESYIRKTMQENVQYYSIFKDNKIISVASSEIDFENKNAEMTDFATLPDFRGKNYSGFILNEMEKEMGKIGIKTLYTIARSKSYGMNITFSKKGYIFSGILVNNTGISGNIESMNVWYTHLFKKETHSFKSFINF